MVLLKKKKYISDDDLSAILSLLDTNITLKDSFDIIENKHNKEILKTIIKRLDDGELIENILNDYLNPKMRNYFKAFISYLSFKDTLKICISLREKEKAINEKLSKDLSYPLSLLIMTTLGIYLFNAYGFNPLIDSIANFTNDISDIIKFKNIINITITIIIFLLLIILLAAIFFLNKKRIILTYIILQKFIPNSIIKEFLSSRFILYFNECHKIGIKTKYTIEILKSFKEFSLISFIAYHVNEAFLNGKSMEEAMHIKYLDYRLSKIIKIAIYANDIGGMLENYLNDFEKRFKKFCNKSSTIIQLTSYLLIGIIIIFVYQILFIPMGIIGGLK